MASPITVRMPICIFYSYFIKIISIGSKFACYAAPARTDLLKIALS